MTLYTALVEKISAAQAGCPRADVNRAYEPLAGTAICAGLKIIREQPAAFFQQPSASMMAGPTLPDLRRPLTRSMLDLDRMGWPSYPRFPMLQRVTQFMRAYGFQSERRSPPFLGHSS
jgi:hypothetical protein